MTDADAAQLAALRGQNALALADIDRALDRLADIEGEMTRAGGRLRPNAADDAAAAAQRLIDSGREAGRAEERERIARYLLSHGYAVLADSIAGGRHG